MSPLRTDAVALPESVTPDPVAVGLALPFMAAADGVRVYVRLTPRARATRIDGVRRDARGRPRLKVAVSEVPEAGRANAALLALLAEEWRVPKSSLAVVMGGGEREKTIRIAGDGGALLVRLQRWYAARGRNRETQAETRAETRANHG